MPAADKEKVDHLLTRRVEKIYPSKEGLKKVLISGKRLRLYQGFDPSTPNLHIGHLVGLLKLKEFQQMGHEVIFLIGDFTGMIGDPTGKLKTRKSLTRAQVLKNAQTYKDQVKRILNFAGKNPVKLKFNSAWNSKLSSADFLGLTQKATVQQLIERDMFQERIKKGQDISVGEFLYPLIQGYDCVAMDVDLELGGSDQLFNMMIGRDLMHKLKGKEKFVMTTKLLVDSKGRKIGKTEGNVINIANPATQFFGQMMSITDEAILPCFELVTQIPLASKPPLSPGVPRVFHSRSERVSLNSVKRALEDGENPMKYKKLLAYELTKMLHGEKAAQKAQKEFEEKFQRKEVPKEIKACRLDTVKDLADVLVSTGISGSRSEAKRVITQGTATVDGVKITDWGYLPKKGDIIKAGKKREFIKLV